MIMSLYGLTYPLYLCSTGSRFNFYQQNDKKTKFISESREVNVFRTELKSTTGLGIVTFYDFFQCKEDAFHTEVKLI